MVVLVAKIWDVRIRQHNITEQNITLKTGLSLNEGTAAGRHLQGQTDLPLRQTNCPTS
jgi:hypothetical protein